LRNQNKRNAEKLDLKNDRNQNVPKLVKTACYWVNQPRSYNFDHLFFLESVDLCSDKSPLYLALNASVEVPGEFCAVSKKFPQFLRSLLFLNWRHFKEVALSFPE
jgi:hypothetical protein